MPPAFVLLRRNGVSSAQLELFCDTFFEMYQGTRVEQDGPDVRVFVDLKRGDPRYDAFERLPSGRVNVVVHVEDGPTAPTLAAARCVKALFEKSDWHATRATPVEFTENERTLVQHYGRDLAGILDNAFVSALIKGDALLLLHEKAEWELGTHEERKRLMRTVFDDDDAISCMRVLVSTPLFGASAEFATLSCFLRQLFLTHYWPSPRPGRVMQDVYAQQFGYVVPVDDKDAIVPLLWLNRRTDASTKHDRLLRHLKESAALAPGTHWDTVTKGVPGYKDGWFHLERPKAINGLEPYHVLRAVGRLNVRSLTTKYAVAIIFARAEGSRRYRQKLLDSLLFVYRRLEGGYQKQAPMALRFSELALDKLAWFLRTRYTQWSYGDAEMFAFYKNTVIPALIDNWQRLPTSAILLLEHEQRRFAEIAQASASVGYDGDAQMDEFDVGLNAAQALEYADFDEQEMDAKSLIDLVDSNLLENYAEDSFTKVLEHLAVSFNSVDVLFRARDKMEGLTNHLRLIDSYADLPIEVTSSASFVTRVAVARAVRFSLRGDLKSARDTMHTLVQTLLSVAQFV